MCTHLLPCGSPDCVMFGKRTFYKVSNKEDEERLEKLLVISLNYNDGKTKTINRLWIEEDLPRVPCIQGWQIKGDEIFITWMPNADSWKPKKWKCIVLKDQILELEYIPGRDTFRLRNGSKDFWGKKDLDTIFTKIEYEYTPVVLEMFAKMIAYRGKFYPTVRETRKVAKA